MKDFLGRGIAFPMGVDAYGALETSSHEESVAESIRLVLGTAVGERVMRPEFGCRIHDLVFHPVNANTCALVSLYTREALVKWEPRIEDIQVRAYPDPTQENAILVNIQYRVRRTNNLRNLVYPFFLRREQDL
ncbi:MAG: GPW/gp25 family protein [Myxococcota bacterium]